MHLKKWQIICFKCFIQEPFTYDLTHFIQGVVGGLMGDLVDSWTPMLQAKVAKALWFHSPRFAQPKVWSKKIPSSFKQSYLRMFNKNRRGSTPSIPTWNNIRLFEDILLGNFKINWNRSPSSGWGWRGMDKGRPIISRVYMNLPHVSIVCDYTS